MKSLYEFMTESLISEAYASDIIKNFHLGFAKNVRQCAWNDWNELQWSRVTDNDLIKLDKPEALKRMRSQKDPGYLLWISDSEAKRWGETVHCNGVTWGWDVIVVYDGTPANYKANHIADMADYAYEVKNPTSLLKSKLKHERQDARAGAYALLDCDNIRQANQRRWEDLLAQKRAPDNSEILKIFQDAMDIYNNCMKKYVEKFVSVMQDGNGSYYEMRNLFKKLNELVFNMMEQVSTTVHFNKEKYSKKWALEELEKVNETVRKIEELVNKFMANSAE